MIVLPGQAGAYNATEVSTTVIEARRNKELIEVTEYS